ncbi:hypothetical protein GCM10010350_82590 [Streptomyces galilaeus]|nr:hypothetical protein GCM10010350_82590 [Streptomyces galilaeus]
METATPITKPQDAEIITMRSGPVKRASQPGNRLITAASWHTADAAPGVGALVSAPKLDLFVVGAQYACLRGTSAQGSARCSRRCFPAVLRNGVWRRGAGPALIPTRWVAVPSSGWLADQLGPDLFAEVVQVGSPALGEGVYEE